MEGYIAFTPYSERNNQILMNIGSKCGFNTKIQKYYDPHKTDEENEENDREYVELELPIYLKNDEDKLKKWNCLESEIKQTKFIKYKDL